MRLKMPFTYLVLYFISFLFIQPAYSENQVRSVSQISKDFRDSVVMIQTEDEAGNVLSFGSGFFVSPSGVIATNLHVLALGGDNITVKLRSGQALPAEAIDVDLNHDAATIKIEGQNFSAVKLTSTPPEQVEVGERVIAIGHPLGLTGTVSDGIVSNVWNDEDGIVIQITVPISSGNSGGPLFNMQGEVIGINAATIEEGQNLNFAIPVQYLTPLIHDRPNPNLTDTIGEAVEEGLAEVVFVTASGEKYHHPGCRYLAKSAIPVSKAYAIELGYLPCKVCTAEH